MSRRVVATRDPALHARVVRRVPLRYAAGADEALDRPAHVRAASGAVWVGASLVVVQDDANFLAVVDPRHGKVVGIPLPAAPDGRRQFDDTRGNKAGKLDLEAVVCVALPEGPAVLAFGSGSTARRESVAVLRGLGGGGLADRAQAAVIHVPRFYATLREAVSFVGSELNVEAVVAFGSGPAGTLRLFNRGNGARRGGLGPVDATCDVDLATLVAHLADPHGTEPPIARHIVQYDLGTIAGLALTFTDASLVPRQGASASRTIIYTAAAEASPDATRDGPVAGCAVGVITEGPDAIAARWALLEDGDGAPFLGKVEGIALQPGDLGRALVVVDRDAPGEPAELCEVVLEGSWY